MRPVIGDLVIAGATLVDGTGTPPAAGSAVVVRGERIAWVGSTADLERSEDDRVLDATGMYVVPGLLDANTHLVLHCDPDVLLRYAPGRYDELVAEAAQVALRAGITTVFDTWGPLESLRRVRDRIDAGELPGSRIRFAGNIIGNDGPWSADFFPYRERLNPEVADEVDRHWEQGVGAELTWMPAESVGRAVRRYLAAGRVDFVKYASSAHAHHRFLAFAPDAQRAIADEAHAAGLTVQACALTPEALKAAIAAGADLLQHANATGRYPLPEPTLKHIADRGLPCATMLYTERFLAAVDTDTSLPGHWRDGMRVKDRNARDLIDAGATVLLATDGGVFGPSAMTSPWVGSLLGLPDVPIRLGASHLSWFQAAWERGMSGMAALQAATCNIAAAYRVDDEIGTVEPGKRADLLVLEADPLNSPGAYGRVAHVVKDGRIVDRARLPENPVLTRDAERPAHHGPAITGGHR